MTPTEDDKDELLLSCRFGDLADVQHYVNTFTRDALAIQDERGNTPIHMVAANGHTDLLAYLLPLLPTHALTQPNHAGSTPLHWAALNKHLGIVQMLVQYPTGPGIDMIDAKNDTGRTPLSEAELAGWDEGARWMVQVMKLDEVKEVEEVEVETSGVPSQAIEVEIQDADGQVARMTIDHQGAVGYEDQQ